MKKKFLFLFVSAALLAAFPSCNKPEPKSEEDPQEQQDPENPGGQDDQDTPGGQDDPTPSVTTTLYTEDFKGFTGQVKSDYTAEEHFTSTTTGVKWTLLFGSINQTEDHGEFEGGNAFTLGGKSGKADDGQSVLYTSTLTGGITKLDFDYVANKDKKLEVQVLVDGKVVWTSGTLELVNNGQSDPKVLQHLSFDITGAGSAAVLKFINISQARRISVGNLKWYDAVGGKGKASDGQDGDAGDTGGTGGEGGDEDGDDDYSDTTLTGDVTVSGASSATMAIYGDFYELGSNDCCIDIYNDKGEGVMSELLVPFTNTNYTGTYTVDPEWTGEGYTALPGYEEDGYMYGSWYYLADAEGNCDAFACIYTGTMTISESAGKYSISVEFYDYDGHKVSCSYNGPLEIEDYSDMSVASSSKSSITYSTKASRKASFVRAASLRGDRIMRMVPRNRR